MQKKQSAQTLADQDAVIMARIAAPFGIKGWLKLQTFTEFDDSLDAFETWFLSSPKGWQAVEIEDFVVNHKSAIVKFKGCDDRTAAELFQKRDVAVPRDWLDAEKDGEYYWIDLIGADVVNQNGELLGRVETLMETGANDVLVVKSETNEILIPFIQQFLINVDRAKKVITVSWEKSWQDD